MYTHTPILIQVNRENSSKINLGVCLCVCVTLLPAALIAHASEREKATKMATGQ